MLTVLLVVLVTVLLVPFVTTVLLVTLGLDPGVLLETFLMVAFVAFETTKVELVQFTVLVRFKLLIMVFEPTRGLLLLKAVVLTVVALAGVLTTVALAVVLTAALVPVMRSPRVQSRRVGKILYFIL